MTVIVRMRRDPVEEALVRARFEAAQWVVRTVDDASGCAEDEVRYRLDGWLIGAVRGARAEAERQVRALTADRPDVKVELAGLAPRSQSEEPSSLWHMYREPGWGQGTLLGGIKRVWIAVGGADTHRTVRIAGQGSPALAEEAFSRSDFGGELFVEGEHGVRRGAAPAMESSGADRDRWWRGRAGMVVRGALCLALVVYGWMAHEVPSPWQGLLVLPLAVAAWGLGRWVTSGAETPWPVRYGAGVLLVTALSTAGYMEAGASAHAPVGIVGSVVLVPAIWLIARGSWHACRSSRLARNLVALAPVLVLPLPWVLPFTGRLLQAGYLNDGFGIPVAAVSVDPVWTYGIAVKPVFFAACALFVCLGLAGWARYFYWSGGGKVLNMVMVAVIALTYLLTITTTSLQNMASAATSAARAAVEGRDPAPYFGIDGTLVCVKPVVDRPAVENGPLPVDHAVLAFERAGDDLWLWDPERATSGGGPLPALSARAEHVATWVPDQGVQRCADKS
ncbi:hypothetical protein ABZ921_33610 [Streptomyces atriruber]|uniref:Uncharacterized protein n=1 Tax=Streptomyces atriruber TaxID=545121 RepID=A0ABV3BYE0_9ACTN